MAPKVKRRRKGKKVVTRTTTSKRRTRQVERKGERNEIIDNLRLLEQAARDLDKIDDPIEFCETFTKVMSERTARSFFVMYLPDLRGHDNHPWVTNLRTDDATGPVYLNFISDEVMDSQKLKRQYILGTIADTNPHGGVPLPSKFSF